MTHTLNQPVSDNLQSAPCNLLVIDDEVGILKAIKRGFNHSKYNVLTALSAEEGLKVLETNDIQVLLSDFRMPETDGGTLVKHVQKQYPDIVSMILTGYADFDAAVDVMNSGAAYKFLSKPWDNQQLLEDVDQAFDEYQLRRADHAKQDIKEQYIKPGRILFDEKAKYLMKRQSHFAIASVVVSDISLFDQYWEKRGQHESALSSVFKTMQACLPSDCEIFETDIDQFLVIIPEHECGENLHGGLVLLQKALSLSYENTALKPKLNCHLSYAVAPFENVSLVRLLHSFRQVSHHEQTDISQSGRDNVVKLDAQHLAQKKRKHTIQTSIQKAITSNQFSLFFQPKVRLDNGLVESAEVLMRWQHSSLGWVSPVEFISLSELDGQIEKIGSWLFSNSIEQLIGLRKQYGDNISLAVNVSPRQLQSHQIVDELKYLLETTQINPSCIELEITEGCVIEDFPEAGDILWQLKDLGVRIAIDDFGSGYTSFSYLSKLPVDVLKLDKILIDDIEENPDAVSMLQSVIGLCQKMHIQIIAEGVETQRQVGILRDLGCDYIQGFVYSRPVTKAQFEKILINQPYRY